MSQTRRHTVAAPRQSSIPLRRPLSRQGSTSSTASSDATHRWKQKLEESEERRKLLLSDKEKALRSLQEVERRHLQLQERHEQLETELFEKNEEFTRLSTASKNLYKEYETLKNQYETETGAMSRALKDATQWYKENRQLRRRTLMLPPDQDAVDEGVDAGGDADIDNLNKTIKQLSAEVAELQTELDSVRQTEFQTQEQNAKLCEELEAAQQDRARLEAGLASLRQDHAQLLRVSDLMRKELEELREVRNTQRNDILQLRKEAGEQKKERNILAHQSNLLLQGLSEENGTDSLMLLQEIESLKRIIEDERTKYEEELNSLQERLEDQENNTQQEILEERLKLVEAELQAALERERLYKAPPPPPPPPPPPSGPPAVPLRRRKSRATAEDLARSVGATPEKKAPAPGVNEDIINAIKEGKFTLRKRKKDGASVPTPDNEAPKAVSELLNILGSLRRAPKKRQSLLVGDQLT